MKSLIMVVFLFLTLPAFGQESSPTDDIVVKASNAVIFQMTANLKLTQEEINAVGPVIADNIAKQRNLQQSLEDGIIDGATMYSQRQKLVNDENQELGAILTADQMRTWINMQNQTDDNNTRRSSSK